MIRKKEIIWREILFQAIEKKNRQLTQKALSEQFSFSLSTVFNALSVPRQSAIVTVSGRSFTVRDIHKWLYLWGTARSLKRDIIYETRVDAPVLEIESAMPADVVYAAYSAVRLKWRQSPADYDAVYVYAHDATEIQKRFPQKKGSPNLIVLKADPWLSLYGQTTTVAQTFVDCWNLPQWYAKDFLDVVLSKA